MQQTKRERKRQNWKRPMLALAACGLMLPQVGQAAEQAKETTKLGNVVFTDTKIAQPQDLVTQKVTVVYGEDFDQQTANNRNVTELFKYDAGQFVNPLSRNDANWGSYGGLGPKYNSYLLDGLPVDSFVDTMSLDPWTFDRAEEYKGPASVLYSNYMTMDFAGNETPLAGTTNLILRDRIESPMTRILAGGGSWNTANARLYHQDHKDNLHYFFGANYEKSDYANYGADPSWLNFIDDPDYQKSKVYGKLSYFFNNDDKLSVFVHHTQHTGDAGRPNRDFDHNYDTINLDYANQINPSVNLQVKTGYRGYDRRWAEDNYPTNLNLREHDGVEQKIYPSDLTVNVKHSGNSMLTVGADSQFVNYTTYAENSGVRSTGNDVDAKSYSLFVQDKYVLDNDKLILRGGGRLNRTEHSYDMISGGAPGEDSQSWDKLLWSAGARYNATPEVALYTNVGTSFVTPSAKSVGGTLLASDLGVAGKNGQLPNPGLDPESGIAYDLGVDFKPIKNLTLGLRGFLNQVDDAIVENTVSANPSQTKSVNAGQAESRGFEVSVDHTLTNSFKWFANLTYTSTEVENSLDLDQDGADLSFSPDYVANAGFTFMLPKNFSVSPYLQMVGDYYDSTSKSGRKEFGSYSVFNLRTEKTLVTSSAYSVVAALDLNNLTNEKFEMPWQFQDPGFNGFGSVEFRF